MCTCIQSIVRMGLVVYVIQSLPSALEYGHNGE